MFCFMFSAVAVDFIRGNGSQFASLGLSNHSCVWVCVCVCVCAKCLLRVCVCECVCEWAWLFRAQRAHINLYANGICKLFKIHMPRLPRPPPCRPQRGARDVKRKGRKKMGNNKRSEKNKTIYLNIYKCFKSTQCTSVCVLCVCINMVFCQRPLRLATPPLALSSCWQNSVNAKSHLNMHEARPQLNFAPSLFLPLHPQSLSLSYALSVSLYLSLLSLYKAVFLSWPIMRRKSQLKLHCAAAKAVQLPHCAQWGMWHVCLPSATYIIVTVANCEWQRNGWMTKTMEVVQTRWEGGGGGTGNKGGGG